MIHFNSSKILIPVDFSDTSLLAIKHGAFLAKYTKGDVYLLHVISKQYEHYADRDVNAKKAHKNEGRKYRTQKRSHGRGSARRTMAEFHS